MDYTTLLTTRKTVTPTARIAEIRTGYSADVIDQISAELRLPKREVLRALGIPATTASRLARVNRPLDQSVSERVERLASIEAEAIEVFGTREEAAGWLTSANLALAGESPLAMLDTEAGAMEVRRVLSGIRYGTVV
jgi:putative toxin-antitoxin system antitoxin component (TIGR02293 family)